MNIPKNCRECEHNHTCNNAYYGGGLCKYKDAIEEKKLSCERENYQR